MESGRIVERPTPVGGQLEFTSEERIIIPENEQRQYNKYETDQLEKFAAKLRTKSQLEKELRKYDILKAKGKDSENTTKAYNAAITKHETEKVKDWQKVFGELKKMKNNMLSRANAALKIAELHDQDYRVPRRGRFVTFPLHNTGEQSDMFNGKPVTIEWSAANTKFTAVYYKVTCWFGNFEDEKAPQGNAGKQPPRFVPFGETDLFIAAEFIEQRYTGAPHLSGLHLKDKFPPNTKWATLCINHLFHYGQNYHEPTYRYLVYQPFIRPREIPQKCFADNIILSNAKSIAASASKASNDYVAQVGTVSSTAITLIESFSSHPLWQFERFIEDKPLYQLEKDVAVLHAQWNAEDSSIKNAESLAQREMAVVNTSKKLNRLMENEVDNSSLDREVELRNETRHLLDEAESQVNEPREWLVLPERQVERRSRNLRIRQLKTPSSELVEEAGPLELPEQPSDLSAIQRLQTGGANVRTLQEGAMQKSGGRNGQRIIRRT